MQNHRNQPLKIIEILEVADVFRLIFPSYPYQPITRDGQPESKATNIPRIQDFMSIAHKYKSVSFLSCDLGGALKTNFRLKLGFGPNENFVTNGPTNVHADSRSWKQIKDQVWGLNRRTEALQI